MYKDFKSGGLMGPPTKNYTVLLQQLWLERGRHNADQSKWKHLDIDDLIMRHKIGKGIY